MKQKDITERMLESYNDVFADIVNNLLFDGKTVVKEDELEDDNSRSQYKIANTIHEQERDVAKFWTSKNIRLAFFGLENQTAQDKNMALRIIGYDGAVYRSELFHENKNNKKYPVITLVLYFGKDRWTAPKSLFELLNIPESLKPFVNDYKINVFEIPYLTKEKVQSFKSDFKYVADYFVQMRINKDYKPSKEQIRHVHEVLQLMSVLTNDNRFYEVANEYEKGELQTMCEVLDKVEARGVEKGLMQARVEAKKQIENSAKKMISTKKLSYEEIAICSGLALEKIIDLAEEMKKDS